MSRAITRDVRSCRAVFAMLGLLLLAAPAAAQGSLSGNSIICTNSANPRFPAVRTLYFSGQRIFQYDAIGKKASSAGIVYNIGGQNSGRGTGDLTYQSSAQVSASQVSLSATVEQTCGICDGRRITVNESFSVSLQGDSGNATRSYRQSFADGTAVAVPGGSDSYSCRVVKGRRGVGG